MTGARAEQPVLVHARTDELVYLGERQLPERQRHAVVIGAVDPVKNVPFPVLSRSGLEEILKDLHFLGLGVAAQRRLGMFGGVHGFMLA